MYYLSSIIRFSHMYHVEMVFACVIACKPRKVKALLFIIRLTRGGRLISAINCDNWHVRSPRPNGVKSLVPTVFKNANPSCVFASHPVCLPS